MVSPSSSIQAIDMNQWSHCFQHKLLLYFHAPNEFNMRYCQTSVKYRLSSHINGCIEFNTSYYHESVITFVELNSLQETPNVLTCLKKYLLLHIYTSSCQFKGKKSEHLVLVNEGFVLGGGQVSQHDSNAAHTKGRPLHLLHQRQVPLQWTGNLPKEQQNALKVYKIKKLKKLIRLPNTDLQVKSCTLSSN